MRAARAEVDKQIQSAEGYEFVDKVIAVLRATTKTHVDMIDSLAALKNSARHLFEEFLVGDEDKQHALEKLTEAMKDEDTRTALAFARLHGIISEYRETSNPSILADPEPDGASWVTLKPLDRSDIKSAERAAGTRPSLGAVLAAKGLDVARRAARKSEDSAEAYARYISNLDESEQKEIERFEQYNETLDWEIFRRSVKNIDGFSLSPCEEQGYPVEQFVNECADAESVIAEAARHARQIGSLDPKVAWPSSWRSGTKEFGQEAAA